MAYTTQDYAITQAIARIKADYGDTVSVVAKKKILRKFGESQQVQTTATTLMGNLTGVYNETYVEQNLITHFASSSTADTMKLTVEGHTAGADVSVSSITQTAGTATVTTSTDHGFAVGDWVNVRGANESEYNGIVQVATAPTSTTFTYTVDSGASSPATGTIITNSYDKTFVSQTVQLAGRTKTALTTPLARCTRMYITEQNKAFNAVGTIYCAEDVSFSAGVPASGVHCTIPAGKNQSRKASTTISKDDYYLLLDFHAHNQEKTSGRVANVELQIRKPGDVFRTIEDLTVNSGLTNKIEFEEIETVPKNSDIRLVAFASTNGLEIGGTFQGYLASIQ